MKNANKLGVMFDGLLEFLAGLCGFVMVAVTFIVCAQVGTRYFLRSPIDWVVEFSQFTLLYIPLLGSAWLLKHEGHVSVTLFTHRLGRKARSLIEVWTSVVCVIVSLVLVWYGGLLTIDLFRQGIMLPEAIPVPQYTIIGVIPVGGLLMLIQFARRALQCFSEWDSLRKGASPLDSESLSSDTH
jgi:C4-dicarboxylate transporter, DctQ subunit